MVIDGTLGALLRRVFVCTEDSVCNSLGSTDGAQGLRIIMIMMMTTKVNIISRNVSLKSWKDAIT
jgi:hypothetical protein